MPAQKHITSLFPFTQFLFSPEDSYCRQVIKLVYTEKRLLYWNTNLFTQIQSQSINKRREFPGHLHNISTSVLLQRSMLFPAIYSVFYLYQCGCLHDSIVQNDRASIMYCFCSWSKVKSSVRILRVTSVYYHIICE